MIRSRWQRAKPKYVPNLSAKTNAQYKASTKVVVIWILILYGAIRVLGYIADQAFGTHHYKAQAPIVRKAV